MEPIGNGDATEKAPPVAAEPAADSDVASKEPASQTSDSNAVPQPKFDVDPTSVCELERQGCREFFLGKSNKTPERYMTIRNHMMELWQATRPQYLTKIKARADLKNCGDVNAIGRVHTFLENSHIINAGSTPVRRRPRPNGTAHRPPHSMRLSNALSESDDADQFMSSDDDFGFRGVPSSTTGRRRKVRDEDGGWVYEDEYHGGRVIAHSVIERHADDEDYSYSGSSSDGDGGRRRSKRRKNGARSGIPKWMHNSNSEFRLIPCKTFGSSSAASKPPFTVRISAAALVLMDLHAHLMYTEIIGLLGGQFHDEQRVVEIEVAFPCNSTSTTTECEMDPASEVEARRVFSSSGRQALGWFHSHPTFEATPSVRDIHNQHAYQMLCRRSSDQLEPFIGVIVSPPGGTGPYGVSDISVFYVMPRKSGDDGDLDGHDDSTADNVPYHMAYEVTGRDKIPDDLIDAMTRLIEMHANMVHRTDLAKRFKRSEVMTTLEKLVISMRCRWSEDVRQQWDDDISLRLRPLLQRYFCRGTSLANGSASATARAHSAAPLP
ncbi:hypothetical protein H4R20_002161 [Coemansia guatemalensis]|uniref:Myb-like, SWIRM and MPN domain-containing protein 1 n=1 Tax=Coemansia guatemalensis TaxID=2761395 RepID=A0A9W8I309_9FUNG|nr:hypothetical protein H4R20_002161 [Coemansia guatemalensis]